jgi:hypothetical protein
VALCCLRWDNLLYGSTLLRRRFSAVQFNNPRTAYDADLRCMQIIHKTWQKRGHFCGIPHSTPRRVAPHLCRSCCGRFRTKELGQATLLHKTIHLSAATVDSVWGTYAARFFNLWISFRTLCADCPWKFCGNSMGKAETA